MTRKSVSMIRGFLHESSRFYATEHARRLKTTGVGDVQAPFDKLRERVGAGRNAGRASGGGSDRASWPGTVHGLGPSWVPSRLRPGDVPPAGLGSMFSLAHPELFALLSAAEKLLAVTGDAVVLCPTYGEAGPR